MTPCSDARLSPPNDSSNTSRYRAPEASAPRCVFVVGMHRSGTSATTEVLGRLGLESPAPDEQIPATGTNQQGHHESKALVRLNERLLTALGGTWTAPPALATGWEHDDSLDQLRNEAADTFASVFPRRTAAWKDPRNCIVLPFWRAVVGPATAAILVYRDAAEVAHSLQSRDGLRLTHGLALWERYVRSACANLDGIPTFCADYRRLLDDPRAWSAEVVTFLAQVGVPVDAQRIDAATSSIDGTLHHQRATPNRTHELDHSQPLIMETLRSLDGHHHPWRSPDLGPEPDWVGDVLAMRLELDQLGRAQRMMERSRAFQFATAVGRLRGRRS